MSRRSAAWGTATFLVTLAVAPAAPLAVAAQNHPTGAVRGGEADSPPDGAIDEAGAEEMVAEVVAPAESERLPWIVGRMGNFHPAVCHFPIAWLVLLCAVELAAAYRGRPVGFSGVFGVSLTVGSFVPVIATGFIRSWSVAENDPESLAEVAVHRNVMITVALLCVAAFALRLRGFAGGRRRFASLYLVVLVVATALVLLGGHLGARLVHGDDYLGF